MALTMVDESAAWMAGWKGIYLVDCLVVRSVASRVDPSVEQWVASSADWKVGTLVGSMV